jgi:hypothetical protein
LLAPLLLVPPLSLRGTELALVLLVLLMVALTIPILDPPRHLSSIPLDMTDWNLAALTREIAALRGASHSRRFPRLMPHMEAANVGVRRASLRVAARVLPTTKAELAQLARLPNKNRPCEFVWLQPLLERISRGVPAASAGATSTPLFIVAGACPGTFAGMQAVMYVAAPSAAPATPQPPIDFWWVKPQRDDPRTLEEQTLQRHDEGPHKNAPGRSYAVYRPLAQLFTQSASSSDEHPKFGLERTRDGLSWRATMRCATQPGVTRYLCLIWQEDWASPIAFQKWIVGKLLYQKACAPDEEPAHFACPFRIDEQAIHVFLDLEEAVPGLMPPDRFKLGCPN